MLSRNLPPMAAWIGMSVAWPKMSHSATSIAERPRISALRAMKERPRADGLPVGLDLERITADQVGRCLGMDELIDGRNAKTRFAEARQALIGGYLDPDELGRIGIGDGLDRGDFQGAISH